MLRITLKSTIGQPLMIARRWMTSKKFREKVEKPAPFPYETKEFTYLQSMLDSTVQRFDENTKLIVVEGPIASGKKELAKYIAEQFEMKYVPPITMDAMYISEAGYDMRNLDVRLPESVQSYDEKNFCEDPWHINCAGFQANYYRLRYAQWFDNLAHLMNTGQGVVTVHSPFSDSVFLDAMCYNNYISKKAARTYYDVVLHTIWAIFRPHLVVYLDVPVEQTIKNIKDRGIPHEVNSKALTPEYLATLRKGYKEKYMLEASVHSKILAYDWSEKGENEVVVEDIERLDFDCHVHFSDTKLSDWRIDDFVYEQVRYRFSTLKNMYMVAFNVMNIEAPEMWIPAHDIEVWGHIWNNAPGKEYEYGFDPRKDKNIAFKTPRDRWDPTC